MILMIWLVKPQSFSNHCLDGDDDVDDVQPHRGDRADLLGGPSFEELPVG